MKSTSIIAVAALVAITASVARATGPDLAVTALVAPDETCPAQPVTLTSTHLNQGDIIAAGQSGDGSWQCQYYLSPNEVAGDGDEIPVGDPFNIGPLAAGESVESSLDFDLDIVTPGLYYWCVQTDSFDEVTETDETNNWLLGGEVAISTLWSTAPSWTEVRWGLGELEYPVMAYDLARQRTVLFGGFSDEDDDFTANTWEFDGTRWSLVSTFGPSPRYGSAMAYDASNARMVLFGGYDDDGSDGETWTWDGVAWAMVSSTGPSPRFWHALTYDSERQRVVLFGGEANGENDETWEWDGANWELVNTGGPSPRSGHAMAYDEACGAVLLYGGSSGENETWAWDGNQWELKSVFGPDQPFAATMAYDSTCESVVLITCSGTWAWDGFSWTQVSFSGECSATRVAYDVDRERIIVLMNESDETQEISCADGWEWSRHPASGPEGRSAPAFAPDSQSEIVLMFGGTLEDPGTWGWDGFEWLLLSNTGPTAGFEMGMVYHQSAANMVLFGGTDFDGGQPFDTTWLWDGNQWTDADVNGPTGRYDHAMAYDSFRNQTVLFGGYDDDNVLGDTWGWDGAIWTEQTPQGVSPSPRRGPAMAYDEARQRVVLYGGEDDSGTLGDTWEWDGAAWTEATPSGTFPPASCCGHVMAYDPNRHKAVLVLPGKGEVWEYDGEVWMPSTSLGCCYYNSLALVSEPVSAQLLLHTGSEESVFRFGTSGFGLPIGEILKVTAPEDVSAFEEFEVQIIVRNTGEDFGGLGTLWVSVTGTDDVYDHDWDGDEGQVVLHPVGDVVLHNNDTYFDRSDDYKTLVLNPVIEATDYFWESGPDGAGEQHMLALTLQAPASGQIELLVRMNFSNCELAYSSYTPSESESCPIDQQGWPVECSVINVREPILGDINGDGTIDLVDYDDFDSCLTGPYGPPPCTTDEDCYPYSDCEENGTCDFERGTGTCHRGDLVGCGYPTCRVFDFDADYDVDLQDFGQFQLVFGLGQ